MKNLVIMFLAVLAIGMTSCGGDDPAEQILGVWNLSTVVYSECTDDDDNSTEAFGDASCEEDAGVTYCTTATVTFTAPGTASLEAIETEDGVVTSTETSPGTYTFSESVDNEVTICFDGDCQTGTITFNDSSMTFVAVDAEEGCTITLNGTK